MRPIRQLHSRRERALICVSLLLILLALAALTGCASLDAQYVAADRQTFESVGPRLQTYKADHPDDTGADDVYRSWQMRLESAEKSLAGEGK